MSGSRGVNELGGNADTVPHSTDAPSHPLYAQYLKHQRGVGPVLISGFDPHKARHARSFWKYSGLDVGPDGAGRNLAMKPTIPLNVIATQKIAAIVSQPGRRSGSKKAVFRR